VQHRALPLIVISLLCFQTTEALAKNLENIHLTWKPTTAVKPRPKSVNFAERITVEEFADVRKNPELLGENRQQPNLVRRVTTKDNVSAFVTEGMRKSLEIAGFGTTRSGGGELTVGGELRQYFVNEEKLYKGNIEIYVSIKDSQGQTRWSGVIKSNQERWGVSYKDNNYFEVLSDLIVNVVNNLLEDPETQKAFAKR